MLLLLDTGIRRGELAGLDVDDVDLNSNRILVKKAKGGSGRVVAFAANCKDTLVEYFEARGTEPGPLLLAVDSTGTPKLGTRISGSGIRQMLSKLGTETGVANVYTHRFRHTFATWAIRLNARELDVQQLLGHKSMAMVRRYTATYRNEQAAAQHLSFSPADHIAKLNPTD